MKARARRAATNAAASANAAPAAEPDAVAAPATLAKRLARLGLRRDWDFVLHLPLRYRDESAITPIAALEPGVEAQVEGTVLAVDLAPRGARRQLVARLRDDSGELLLRWLHFHPSQRAQLTVGRRLRALGTVRGGLMGTEIIHPSLRAAGGSATLPTHLVPIYPSTDGLPQHWLRKRIERALREVDLTDALPAAVRAPLGLPELGAALRELHQPPLAADREALAQRRGPAWERVIFDELLAQQVALREARIRRSAASAPPLRAPAGASDTATGTPASLSEALRAALPFALTADQDAVWAEIAADLAAGVPMNRLLQGDVGSGKTVVAALAAARAVEAGWQAALMAPTEILAEQHFRRIEQCLAPLGVPVAWLAGRARGEVRRSTLRRIADGEVPLVVGTHALIQDEVHFARLGLAVVDEQHRFGVGQRLALRSHGGLQPHLLMLSATPIPRTLAMSYLADVDVSVIRHLPPGRSPVRTKLAAGSRREEVLRRVRGEVGAGRQAYWVCPLVEENQDIEATAATQMAEQARAALPDLRIGLLHGQLPAAEKAATMTAFAAGEIDVLVATTVVEVGIDVPNATLMVIEHAQRFGLATLHQLRGRVGRGAGGGVCVLLFDEPLSETARARLKVLYETSDGFEIARRDLELRGPGEFLGARQWGAPMLRVAELQRDAALVEPAQRCAAELPPEAGAALVARWFAATADFLGA